MSTKGQTFERTICYRLSHWWTGDPEASVFWRTSQSGGRATVRKRKGKSTSGHYGDLCATDPVAEPFFRAFTVECKKGYNRCSVQDVLDKPKKGAKQEYEKWLEQAELSRQGAGALFWMIILKRDKREPLAWLPREFVAEWPVVARARNIVTEAGILVTLEDFLHRVDRVAVESIVQGRRNADSQ